jgi:steroid 5-alpha reductase family enzyme
VLWYATQATGETERKMLVAALAVLYAGRLGFFILLNRVIGKTEDARYRRLREQWGSSEKVRMFGYFQLQALAVAAFSLPFLVLIRSPRPPFALIELVGLLIWIVAVSGEAMADRQLTQFRSKSWNRDRVCRDGLWRYSRHPNYFFEWLHWWAESYGHSLGGAAGPREPGRGLSRVPTDDERVLPVVSEIKLTPPGCRAIQRN